jgi:hypothetical protein
MQLLRILLLSSLLGAATMRVQEQSSPVPGSEAPLPPLPVPAMQVPIKLPSTHIIRERTIVPVRLMSGINAKEAKLGDKVTLALDHDFWVGDLLIAKQGTPVEAIVV